MIMIIIITMLSIRVCCVSHVVYSIWLSASAVDEQFSFNGTFMKLQKL